MKGSRRSLGAVIAAALLVATACGSTLPQARQTQQTQQEGVEVGGDEFGDLETLPPGARINKKGQVVSAQGEVLGTAEEFGISPGADGGTAVGPVAQDGGSTTGRRDPTSPGASAPGVTATTIALGLFDPQGWAGACATVGAQCPGIDFQRAWQALVDDTNRRGGIAGRKVQPVYHQYSVASDNWVQESQEACADWTQDRPVFAALSGLGSVSAGNSENFLACMEAGGAAVINGNSLNVKFDDRVFRRYPHHVAPFAMDLNTQATTLVDGLVKQKYFGKDARLGLIIFDEPYWDYATERSLIPALRRHRLELASIARLHSPQGLSEVAQTANDANNASLKFKSEGVTHAMMLDYNGLASFFFMQAAENQQYRPRYGLTSQSFGAFTADALGGDAKDQLHGTRIVGWSPAADVRAEDEPPFVHDGNRKRCYEVMRRGGVQTQNRESQRVVLEMCDTIWITKAIIEAGGERITDDSLISGIDRLQSSFVPASTFAARVTAEVRDGVAAVAPLSFLDECSCFRYIGRPYAISN